MPVNGADVTPLHSRDRPQVVELTAQNVVMDSFVDTQSRANSLKWFTLVYAFLAKYGQRVSEVQV